MVFFFLFLSIIAYALTHTHTQRNTKHTSTTTRARALRYQNGLPLYRSQYQVFANAPMLVNTAFGLEYPFPLPPLVKFTGPLMPSAANVIRQPLPQSLAQWLDRNTKPVVVVLTGKVHEE